MLKKWLKVKRPELLDEDQELIVPISWTVISAFNTEMILPATIRHGYINNVSTLPDGTPIPYSITSMTGLSSVVVDRYKRENKELNSKMTIDWSNQLRDYAKLIDELRRAGLMDPDSGAQALLPEH